jgi:hypothetical protein
MSCLANLEKAPTDHLDYDVDFGRWLPEGDTIIDASSFIADTVTFVVTQTEVANQVVRVWIDGGADGEEGLVAVYAFTAGGREKEACFKLRIKDC